MNQQHEKISSWKSFLALTDAELNSVILDYKFLNSCFYRIKMKRHSWLKLHKQVDLKTVTLKFFKSNTYKNVKIYYCQTLCPFCVHVSKRSRKWTQTDNKVIFHLLTPPVLQPQNFLSVYIIIERNFYIVLTYQS